jgi:hypothetical protein
MTLDAAGRKIARSCEGGGSAYDSRTGRIDPRPGEEAACARA